ncbi:hypothetical protein [Flavobacterium notoginsengisoli]|uniref:hypothetical protein n=1 Tax=Flavobacterium notoginsengisoli TaxID=1478199 RepID=UPI003644F169
MPKRILFLFLLFTIYIVNAQTNSKATIDQLVSNYIKELQSRKIDTICVYESYCVGSIMTYDEPLVGNKETCIDDLTNEPAYLFWKEKGKTFLTKINYCWEFSTVNIPKDDFWQIYFSNDKTIKEEIIKPYEYETYENSKKVRYRKLVDHSCHHNFRLLLKGKIIEKRFDDFALQKKDQYSQESNINYEHNINLKSKLIVDILEKITSEAEKNNTFKKIKSR